MIGPNKLSRYITLGYKYLPYSNMLGTIVSYNESEVSWLQPTDNGTQQKLALTNTLRWVWTLP